MYGIRTHDLYNLSPQTSLKYSRLCSLYVFTVNSSSQWGQNRLYVLYLSGTPPFVLFMVAIKVEVLAGYS